MDIEWLFKDKRAVKDRIIHEIWLDTRMPKPVIEEIVNYQFHFIKHKAMRDFKNVWLQGLGMFGIKPKRMDYFKENFRDGIYSEAELLQARRRKGKTVRSEECKDTDNC